MLDEILGTVGDVLSAPRRMLWSVMPGLHDDAGEALSGAQLAHNAFGVDEDSVWGKALGFGLEAAGDPLPLLGGLVTRGLGAGAKALGSAAKAAPGAALAEDAGLAAKNAFPMSLAESPRPQGSLFTRESYANPGQAWQREQLANRASGLEGLGPKDPLGPSYEYYSKYNTPIKYHDGVDPEVSRAIHRANFDASQANEMRELLTPPLMGSVDMEGVGMGLGRSADRYNEMRNVYLDALSDYGPYHPNTKDTGQLLKEWRIGLMKKAANQEKALTSGVDGRIADRIMGPHGTDVAADGLRGFQVNAEVPNLHLLNPTQVDYGLPGEIHLGGKVTNPADAANFVVRPNVEPRDLMPFSFSEGGGAASQGAGSDGGRLLDLLGARRNMSVYKDITPGSMDALVNARLTGQSPTSLKQAFDDFGQIKGMLDEGRIGGAYMPESKAAFIAKGQGPNTVRHEITHGLIDRAMSDPTFRASQSFPIRTAADLMGSQTPFVHGLGRIANETVAHALAERGMFNQLMGGAGFLMNPSPTYANIIGEASPLAAMLYRSAPYAAMGAGALGAGAAAYPFLSQ